MKQDIEQETFLQQLRRLSVERAIHGFKTYEGQPITYWTTAVIGEFGELCNMIKKMKRAENGGHDSGHSYTAKSITQKMIREEIGGTLIYIDLLCSILNVDLQEAITETFNEKSIELGFPYLLNTDPNAQGSGTTGDAQGDAAGDKTIHQINNADAYRENEKRYPITDTANISTGASLIKQTFEEENKGINLQAEEVLKKELGPYYDYFHQNILDAIKDAMVEMYTKGKEAKQL